MSENEKNQACLTLVPSQASDPHITKLPTKLCFKGTETIEIPLGEENEFLYEIEGKRLRFSRIDEFVLLSSTLITSNCFWASSTTS